MTAPSPDRSRDAHDGPDGPDGPDDHAVAAQVAAEAGALLREVRARGVAEAWSSARLKDAGDRAAHELLVDRLAALRPGDVVLSEEGRLDAAHTAARLAADRVWVVDPLDGTREFSEPPRHDWAVHVALWERRADDLTAGAVALPGLDSPETHHTGAPSALPARVDGPLRVAVSRSRPPAEAEAVRDALGAELVPMGSAGWKVLAVVRGEVDAYVHAGGQYEWDSAAPVAVARAAGLVTRRVDGSPLRYNQRDVALPDLVVARPEVAARILEVLADQQVRTRAAGA